MNREPKSRWRSLEELEDSPEFRKFVEAEFPSEAGKFTDPVSRRSFLKVMGASLALASLAGCRWPDEEILPFAGRPEGSVPGKSKRFASHFEMDGYGFPVLVTSHDGRPIKVDGNPDHPMSLGGSDAVVQAAVLSLYDPDRSRSPVRTGVPESSEAFRSWARERFGAARADDGAGIAVLVEPTDSPTFHDLKARFAAAFPKAGFFTHDAFPRDAEPRAVRASDGAPLRALPLLENAEVILALDDDLLGDHPAAARSTRHFARRRRATDRTMNRLFVVEPAMTITGGMADHRIVERASRIPAFARALAAAVEGGGVPAERGPLFASLAADLIAHRGKCLVTAGRYQPPEVHGLVLRMNLALGNVGKTVRYVPEAADRSDTLPDLVAELEAGRVKTLLILGGNPGFTAPGFAKAMAKAEVSIHLSEYIDETSERATWHVNRTHWLEEWGDVRAFDGTAGVVQPCLRPLYDGLSVLELLALAAGDELAKGHDLVRRTWAGLLGGGDFEKSWRRALHDGLLAGGESKGVVPAPPKPSPESPETRTTEVLVRRDYRIRDGRHANNAWLQELPDPVTKLVWGNAALVAPSAGFATGRNVRVGPVTLPAYRQPGTAPGTVLLPAGYGRRRGGRVADGVGVDVYPARGAADFAAADGETPLASTSHHHAIDIDSIGRRAVEERMHDLVREATLAEYLKDPEFAKHAVHHPPLVSLWQERTFEGRQWAMSIDLSMCTGCSACVTACMAENNVPVVGKAEVLEGRDMHWLRVDRYYGGDPDDPAVVHQPLPCMQCENAPCEQVCPVAATVHSSEGLNDMVYNRCVGTRYCSNNCPYKVRRFNWFANHRNLTDIEKMRMNPAVTVRSRGVMEKCTYCVQRISAARITAKSEGREVRDGDVVPACAAACPAEAIVFGDLSDPMSRVSRLHASDRCYSLLSELNVKPRTRYLARLRNPLPGGGGR